MSHSKRLDPIRISTAIAAAFAVLSLGIAMAPASADEPKRTEDIEVPPAAEPAPPPPAPAPAPARAAAPAPAPADEDAFFLYLSGNAGGSFAKGDSDGYNFLGSFNNNGHDRDETAFGGGALGVGWRASDAVGVRVELEGEAARGYDFATKSINGTLDYETNVQTWNLMGNIWLDFPITEMFSVFTGGGLGIGVTDIDTTDFQVGGNSRDDTTFAWQVGGGFTVDLTDWLALDTSYRYIDLGQPDLTFNGGNGLYELELTSPDVVMGVRFNFFSF